VSAEDLPSHLSVTLENRDRLWRRTLHHNVCCDGSIVATLPFQRQDRLGKDRMSSWYAQDWYTCAEHLAKTTGKLAMRTELVRIDEESEIDGENLDDDKPGGTLLPFHYLLNVNAEIDLSLLESPAPELYAPLSVLLHQAFVIPSTTSREASQASTIESFYASLGRPPLPPTDSRVTDRKGKGRELALPAAEHRISSPPGLQPKL